MKYLILLFCLLSLSVKGASVALAWNFPCNTNNVSGYNIYYGSLTNTIPTITQSTNCSGQTETVLKYQGNFTNSILVSGTSVTVSNLIGGDTYFFATTAVDGSGNESIFSSEVPFTTPIEIQTNWGAWGGITNWQTYCDGDAPPVLSMVPFSYNVQWIIPPQVVTNSRGFWLTNNGVVLMKTNSWLTTNYLTSSVRRYLLSSDVLINTNWVVLESSDLVNWTPFIYGSNCPVYNEILNNGGNAFFRLKF